jgi:acyl-CoA synthetase (AMP-forming)/AMP-acid ligase II
MVKISGRCIYLEDIDSLVYKAFAAARVSKIASAPVCKEGQEGFVVLYERSRKQGQEVCGKTIAAETRFVIYESLGVRPYEVVCLDSNTIPFTTSGKVKRSECSKIYEALSQNTETSHGTRLPT